MNMSKNIKVLLYSVVMTPSFGFAQTINTGILQISSGTQMSTVQKLDNKVSGDLINDGELFIYNHLNNDGVVTYSAGNTNGMMRMLGSSGNQDITGSIPLELFNVEFNNSSAQPAFHLAGEIRVSGIADFNQGIIDNDSYNGLVVFENASNYTNVDNASHVNGVVQKNGDEPFIYPTGDGGFYRHAGISAPNDSADSFRSKYFFQNPDSQYPLSSKASTIEVINNKEYWTIEKAAGNSDIVLTLSWDESSTTPSTLVQSPESAIHIVRWDAIANKWIDEGGIVDSSNKTVTTPANVSGYSVFTIARVNDKINDDLMVYNAISLTEDGKNDYFRIEGLKNTDNSVEIFNRWGVKVYETTAYNTHGNVFKGFSEGRLTIDKSEKLPVGTYFYVLKCNQGGRSATKTGYLYINQ